MKYKRSALAVLVAAACGLSCALAPVSASAKAHRPHYHLTVGLSDNGYWIWSVHNLLRLHVPTARLMVPWNVVFMRDKSTLNYAREWLNGARVNHVEPMVSFSGNGNYVPSDNNYTIAIKAFLHEFPWVKTYTPWNEPEWPYRALSLQPGLAAAYFNTLVRWCHHCTIVAGDFYRPASDGLESWIRAYKRGLRFKPAAWAIHPYDDVRTHTSPSIQVLERYVGGSQIWLDEISGVLRRGHWPFPDQSPNAANSDERFMFVLPKIFHNITRIYHYQLLASRTAPWDSALLGPAQGPRPAYWTFANALKGKLP